MASGPITLRQTEEEKVEVVTDFIFLGSKITADSNWSHEIKRCLLLGRKAMTNLGGILKTRDITLLYGQSYGFSSSRVGMWELDHKGWTLKNWCFWIVVLDKTLESPLESQEIKPVNPTGNESWIFTGKTDVEAETPILSPLDAKSWLWKRPWFWERLKAKGEGSDRQWDGCIVSPAQWTCTWVNSGRQWRTGEPAMLQSTGSKSGTRLSDWTANL